MYDTWEDAQAALETAQHDVAADFGEEAVDAGWSDIVNSVAMDCTPEVAQELRRTNL